MKKIILTLAYILAGTAFTFAQISDTSAVGGGTPAVDPPKGKTWPPQYQENTVIIESHQLPEELRSTLRDKEYKGWENSTIYHDRSKNHYIFQMRGDSTATYRFDRGGRRIKDNDNP